jgi:serine phosphatase RsbU (regulator of sigma subunit)
MILSIAMASSSRRSDRDQFGEERLYNTRDRYETGEALLARILTAIESFRGEAEQSDNITVVTAARL